MRCIKLGIQNLQRRYIPMIKKTVSILYCPGTNCEEETLAAFKLAGGKPKLIFLNNIISGKKKITDCDVFCVPGGFSFGDYIDTGIVAATLIKDFMPQLIEAKIPTIGICNGFQILMRAGIFGKGITLTKNDSGFFCSKPVTHAVEKSNCLWTRNLREREIMQFPAAHGGGKVVITDKNKRPNIVLTYLRSKSPNGGHIAGICTDNGLVFGLMDHPERPYGNKDGQLIFRNGLNF